MNKQTTNNQSSQNSKMNNHTSKNKIDWSKERSNLDKMINLENLSYCEIGRRYGVSDTTIKKHAKKLGIKLTVRNSLNKSRVPWNKGMKRVLTPPKISKQKLKKNLHNQENSAKKHNDSIKKYPFPLREIQPGQCSVCGKFNCNDDFCKNHNFLQLIGFVKHLKFDSTKIGTEEVKTEFERVRSMVFELYWEQKLSLTDLGQRFNYGRIIPAETMDNLNIPRRHHSDATSLAILQGKLVLPAFTNSFYGNKPIKHKSWEGKTFLLRSTYEQDFALELDSTRTSYLVEELVIEYYDTVLNKERIAIPDFYLPETGEIVEIKSDFTLDIQEMLDKFLAYKKLGYSPKLILEHEEIDLYNIENLISSKRLDKIKI